MPLQLQSFPDSPHKPETGASSPEKGKQSKEALFSAYPEGKNIIEKTPELKNKIDTIKNLEEVLQKLEANKHIFAQVDNAAAKKRFLAKLVPSTSLSTSGQDVTSFGAPGENKGEKKQALFGNSISGGLDINLDSHDESKVQEKESKKTQEESKKTQEESEKTQEESEKTQEESEKTQEESEKTQEESEKTQEESEKTQEESEKTQEESEKNEKTEKLEQIDKNMKDLAGITTKAQNALSAEGRTAVESAFQKAKRSPNNPAIDTLTKQGISKKDIASGRYDSYIRASVLLGMEKDLRANKYIANESDWKSAMQGIRTLNIVPSNIIPQDIGKHIQDRFPHGSEADRVIDEIKTSSQKSNFESVYYDGTGDKYTILEKGGAVSKEVSMNPPKVSILKDNLKIDRELFDKDEEEKRSELLGNWQNSFKEREAGINNFQKDLQEPGIGLQNSLHLSLIHTPSYETNGKPLVDPKSSLEEKIQGAQGLQRIYEQARDTPENVENKDLYDKKANELATIGRLLVQEQQKKKQYTEAFGENTRAYVQREQFEKTARNNLDWLTEEGFGKAGAQSQEVLSALQDTINVSRGKSSQIRLDEPLSKTDKDALQKSIEKLGGNKKILSEAKGVQSFQATVKDALTYPPDHPKSIRGILLQKENADTPSENSPDQY